MDRFELGFDKGWTLATLWVLEYFDLDFSKIDADKSTKAKEEAIEKWIQQ